MKETLESFREQLAGVQSKVESLNLEQRFRDYDHALAEFNARAASSGSSAEESKTKVLELERRVKTQQDSIDQFRDQLDRLQRELIQLRTKLEAAAAPSPAIETEKRLNRESEHDL